MAFWRSGSIVVRDEWADITLENFPATVDTQTFHKILDSLEAELDSLEATDTLLRRIDTNLHTTLQFVPFESHNDSVVSAWRSSLASRWKKDSVAAREITAHTPIADPGPIRGSYHSGWLGQKGLVIRKISHKFFVLTGKNFAAYETVAKYLDGHEHSSLIPLRKCSGVRVNDEKTGFELTFDGTPRVYFCQSEAEAVGWTRAIQARIGFIRYLDAKENKAGVDQSDVERVFAVFRDHTLTEWDLTGVSMDEKTLSVLGWLLLSLSCVTKVVMDGCGITDEMLVISRFGHVLGQCTSVAWLSLRNNKISSDVGALELCKMFHQKSCVSHLFLDGNPLGAVVPQILHTLPLQPCILQSLSLADTQLDTVCAAAACKSLDAQASLVGAKGVAVGLALIDFSENNIGDAGLRKVSALLTDQGVARVNLSNCGATPVGIAHLLSACITANSSARQSGLHTPLQGLELCRNDWDAATRAQAGDLVKEISSLQEFGIDIAIVSRDHLKAVGILAEGRPG